MTYIDKSALVAEIYKRIKAIPKDETDKRLKAVYGGEAFVLMDLLDFIDTLEVKDVDLEEIIEQTYFDNSVTDNADIDHVTYENIAKYFVELGLTSQKGE